MASSSCVIHLPLGDLAVGSQASIGRGSRLPDDPHLSRLVAVLSFDAGRASSSITWMARRAGRLHTASGPVLELACGAQRQVFDGDLISLIGDTGRYPALVRIGQDPLPLRPAAAEWARLESECLAGARAAAGREARAQTEAAQSLADVRDALAAPRRRQPHKAMIARPAHAEPPPPPPPPPPLLEPLATSAPAAERPAGRPSPAPSNERKPSPGWRGVLGRKQGPEDETVPREFVLTLGKEIGVRSTLRYGLGLRLGPRNEVTELVPRGEAERAGMVLGDIVVACDDFQLKVGDKDFETALINRLRHEFRDVGESVRLHVRRPMDTHLGRLLAGEGEDDGLSGGGREAEVLLQPRALGRRDHREEQEANRRAYRASPAVRRDPYNDTLLSADYYATPADH